MTNITDCNLQCNSYFFYDSDALSDDGQMFTRTVFC